jgi:hypothetical protein
LGKLTPWGFLDGRCGVASACIGFIADNTYANTKSNRLPFVKGAFG